MPDPDHLQGSRRPLTCPGSVPFRALRPTATTRFPVEPQTAAPGAVAYLFPSFPMRDPEARHDAYPGLPEVVRAFADRAAEVVDVTPRTFLPPARAGFATALEATLQAQYACYVESLAIAEWLGRHYPPCDYVAGYSMGLFPAACHAGAVSFADGLRIMRDVCRAGHRAVDDRGYAVGAVFGMTEDEVRGVAARVDPEVEITDIYGPRSFLVSGRADPVAAVLAACEAQGASESKLIPVTAPFHASAMRVVEPGISAMLASVPVAAPRAPVLSCCTQRLLRTADDVRDEFTRNISSGMNWYQTMRALVAMDVRLFLECGTTPRLTNMARREVPGDYTIRSFLDFADHAPAS
jgi:[acyl-carrier-protein] S-malonyltransferase